MSVSSVHRPTILFATMMLTLATGGCSTQVGSPAAGSSSGTSADTRTRAMTPTAKATRARPAPAATGPLTPQEVLWLYEVEKLEKQMEAAGTNMPTNVTPRGLAATANQMRECSRALSRAGSPGTRLQPVYVLAKAGCRNYDKGAKCLATATGLPDPLTNDSDVRKMTEALTCAATSLGTGGLGLVSARLKAEEIKAAALE
jgi:hypothetical protein